MSDLEGDVREVIAAMGRGDTVGLSSSDQRDLAYWVLKTTIMAEYTHDASRAVSPAQRAFVYEHREDRTMPPQTWVYVGTLDYPREVMPLQYAHRSAIITLPSGIQVQAAQQTTFSLARLVLCAISVVDAFLLNVDLQQLLVSAGYGGNLCLISPQIRENFWFPTTPMSAERVDVLHDMLPGMLRADALSLAMT